MTQFPPPRPSTLNSGAHASATSASSTSSMMGGQQTGEAARARMQDGAQDSALEAKSPDDLTRLFNTALITTRMDASRDFTAELYTIIDSPGFRAILSAVRGFARLQGISEKDAAEQLISTFRKVDRIWSDYLMQEGIDRVKAQL